jgi:iron complex outermembrane receptor protein
MAHLLPHGDAALENNVIARQPVLAALRADVSAVYGNYFQFRSDTAFNAPLEREAAVRGAMFHVQRTGCLCDGTDDEDETGGRQSFLVRPSDILSSVLVADYLSQQGKGTV